MLKITAIYVSRIYAYLNDPKYPCLEKCQLSCI